MSEKDEMVGLDLEAALEAAFEAPVNMDEVAGIRKDSMLPAGWYVSTPPVSLNARFQKWPEDAPSELTSAHPRGRLVFAAFGDFGQGPQDAAGKLRFEFSPVRYDKPDSNNVVKPDLKSRLYAQVCAAYEKAVGERPSTPAALKSFIETYPVKVRAIQGETDNMVVAVQPVRA